MAILPDNEYTEFENRSYVNPQVSLDEQTAFIDNLRSTQQANNQQIKTDTYNLGTAIPSNLGGLTGGEGYFTSRYQTPQTNSLANDLRAVAQASALNQILENEQAKMKKKYNDAYNANKKRNSNSANPSTDDDEHEDDPEFIDTSKIAEGNVPGVAGGYTVGLTNPETGEVYGMRGVPYGEEGNTMYDFYYEDADSTSTRKKVANAIANNGTTYLHTLPNGHRVLVDESKYTLEKRNGGYVLKDKSTGDEYPVGG